MIKVCTSELLVLMGEKLKTRLVESEPCIICYLPLNEDSIKLKCSHVFHEACLWVWVY